MKNPVDFPHPESDRIRSAALVIRSGGLVVFPTETVYGLGADALNAEAVARIFAAKGRPADNPLIVHLSTLDDADSVASEVPSVARALFARFAPGPLTVVLPARRSLTRLVTAGLQTVAIRIPRHPLALELLRESRRPIAAPSANRSGEPSPTTVEMARSSLGDAAEIYLDGGACEVGLESTVISVSDDRIVILRPGGISAEEIQRAVPAASVEYAGAGEPDQQAVSPGTRHRHYQPRAFVGLVDARDPDRARAASALAGGPEDTGPVAVIGIGPDVDRIAGEVTANGADSRPEPVVRRAESPDEYARNLYRWFVELDALGVRRIIAVLPPDGGIGRALRDRLERSSGRVERERPGRD